MQENTNSKQTDSKAADDKCVYLQLPSDRIGKYEQHISFGYVILLIYLGIL